MTLLLTGVTTEGIVMAADSMVTARSTHTPEAQKLYRIPHLTGGVSVWGRGNLEADRPDVWLKQFLNRSDGEFETLSGFADTLAQDAADYFGAVDLNQKRTVDDVRASLGFHVAGYENGDILFFNINNYTAEGRDPAAVRLAPKHKKVRTAVDENGVYQVRNGDWEPFGEYFKKFTEFGKDYTRKSGDRFIIPYPPDDLVQWAKFYGFQVLLMSGIYELSNLTPYRNRASIGGDVNVLMMEPDTVIKGVQQLVIGERGLQLERV